MSFLSKIRGTFETLFQLGKGGSQLKENSGVLEAKNSDDSAFVKFRCDTPAGSDDAATKGYVDGEFSGSVRTIRFTIGTSTGNSTATIPANARVLRSRVEVTTPYDGSGTIEVGQTGSTSLIQTTSDNDASAANIYDKPQDTDWGGSALAVLATVGGTPTVGAAVITTEYTSPDS